MPELPHLILPRAEVELERRKRRGFGRKIARNPVEQFERVRRAIDEALANYAYVRTTVIDPELIVRVRTAYAVPEEEWTRAGLIVLGQSEDDSVVLFSTDAELTAFRARLEAYNEGIPDGQKNPQYAALIGSIEELRPIEPRDRIGSALRSEGFESPDSFAEDRVFLLDAELWDVGTQQDRMESATALRIQIEQRGGEVTDQYVGHSFTAIRLVANGRIVRWLLTVPLLRLIDLPPEVDAEVGALLDTTLDGLGQIEPPDENAPAIAIIELRSEQWSSIRRHRRESQSIYIVYWMPDMIQILDPGNRGYGDSERNWADGQFPEIMDQTGLHESHFERLTELARAKVAQF